MFRGLFLEETPYASILVSDHVTSRKRPLNLGILGGSCLREVRLYAPKRYDTTTSSTKCGRHFALTSRRHLYQEGLTVFENNHL